MVPRATAGDRPRLISAVVLAFAAASAGCAGSSAFSPSFPVNDATALRRAMARLPRVEAGTTASGRAMVFLVTRRPAGLVAYDLGGRRVLWRVDADVASRVAVGRSGVYHTSNGHQRVVGRRLGDGTIRWSVPIDRGQRFRGLAADGDRVYGSFSERAGRKGDLAAHLIALDGRTGRMLWTKSLAGELGAPSARGGLVFVPLRRQEISVVDGASGRELARVRSTQEALLWARPTAQGVFFGGKSGVYRLDQKAAAGTRAGATFLAASLPTIKGLARAYGDDSYYAPASYSAYDRSKLLWRVNAGAPLAFVGNTVYAAAYRFFFAFDVRPASGKTSRLLWAFSFPRTDVVASTHTGDSLLLVSAKGDIVSLDLQTGAATRQAQLGLAVRGATFDADGFRGALPAASQHSDLARTLTTMIRDPDRRLDPIKLFCVDRLGEVPGASASTALLEIIQAGGVTKAVQRRAAELLVARKDAELVPLYLRSLALHYSFLRDRRPRAVAVLARALGALRIPEAVQPLLLHLADHETPAAALVAIVQALEAIGDRSVIGALRDFLLTYRCDPEFEQTPEALTTTAQALLDMGGAAEQRLLNFVADDAQTIRSLRNYLAAAPELSVQPEPADAHPTTPAAGSGRAPGGQ